MPVSVSSEEREESPAASLGILALALGCLAVFFAVGLFVWSGVTTASARISASTSNESSLLTAASIDLVVEGSDDVAATRLAIDAAGLYPGLQMERCFAVTYLGTAEAVPVRLFGQPDDGTGLEQFIDTKVELGTGTDLECSDFDLTRSIFENSLVMLWDTHGSYDAGLELMGAAADGETTWVRVTVEVVDDNRAQGLTAAFWLTIEART